jgi:hypothetical protein
MLAAFGTGASGQTVVMNAMGPSIYLLLQGMQYRALLVQEEWALRASGLTMRLTLE